jgi:hypothetical protein
MRNERKSESICTFARALFARKHDTWIVRSVYEELSEMCGLPIRPADHLERDLGFVPEDLEDCVEEVSRRAGRSLVATEKNPMFDRVTTVADLVAFLEHQPRT